MIDIHSHILPRLDDGSTNANVSFEMLEIAAADGITGIIASPHSQAGKDLITKEAIDREVDALNQRAQKEGLGISVLPGCEWSVVSGIPELIEQGFGCSMAHGRYLLLELSPWQELSFYRNAVFEIMIAGYVPILAHAERCSSILRHPSELLRAIQKGVLVQVNANSVCGRNGRKIKTFVLNLIKKRMVHFIASDAHNTDSRPPMLSEAYEVVKKKFGEDTAQRLFYANGLKVMHDEQIYLDDPLYSR